jgi:hypothetical protein
MDPTGALAERLARTEAERVRLTRQLVVSDALNKVREKGGEERGKRR